MFRLAVSVVTKVVHDKEKCSSLIAGYETAAHLVGSKPILAETKKVPGEIPASP